MDGIPFGLYLIAEAGIVIPVSDAVEGTQHSPSQAGIETEIETADSGDLRDDAVPLSEFVDNASEGKVGRCSWGNEAAEKGKSNRRKRDIPKS